MANRKPKNLMYDFVLFILVIVLVIVLIVSLVYITRASIAVSGTSDPDLEKAHTYLAWTSGVLWSLIAVTIIGSIALVVFGPEFLPLLGKTVVYLFLFAVVAVVITIGIMAAIAASYISSSPSITKDDIRAAYDDCVIAAVITLATIGIIIIGMYITWHTSKAAQQAEVNTDTNTNINKLVEQNALSLLASA